MYIRLMPMSSEDKEFIGKSINEIQKDFFEDYLKKDGWYYFAKNGSTADEGDLLFF